SPRAGRTQLGPDEGRDEADPLPADRKGRCLLWSRLLVHLAALREAANMSGLSPFLMNEVEMPLVPVVAEMEDTGYPIDAGVVQDLRDRLGPEADRLLDQIRETAGEDFNPKSGSQVAELLYERLDLKVTGRTKTGAPATDRKALERLASQHEVVPLLQ